jgi:hypothetical protein
MKKAKFMLVSQGSYNENEYVKLVHIILKQWKTVRCISKFNSNKEKQTKTRDLKKNIMNPNAAHHELLTLLNNQTVIGTEQ